MKRYFKILIPALFLTSVFLCIFVLELISQIHSYSTLLNYVGIVRGGTQRLIKLEISNQPSDDLIVYLDEIIEELNTGEGKYDLITVDDPTYHNYLETLNVDWVDLKKEISLVREGNDSSTLLTKSEAYFVLANNLAFSAEHYSNIQSQRLSIFIIGILVLTMIAWTAILTLYVRKLVQLQSDNKGLSDIAYLDPLTGAINLEKFKIDAQELLLKNPSKHFAVLYVDFENFKYLNDIFGYEYGNKILKEYASLLNEDMGILDTYCRISADNFLILRCYETKEALLAQQKAIDEKVSQFVLNSQEHYLIWLCCGICCLEDVLEPLQIPELMERANFARKTVKGHPHLHYAFYDEGIRKKMLAEKAIENRMDQALENQEFVVYLQPKVLLTSDKIAGAEALVRWQPPNEKLIPPNEFIPIFEKNLFIVKLDQYVFEQVCIWMRSQLDLGHTMVPISVNVSRMLLYDSSFVPTYTNIKEKYQIPNGMIEIEFTESVVFENMSLLLHIIDDLKNVGFSCSLDDFGTGYSSLNLLKSLPVDVLKLDGLFFDKKSDTSRARKVIEGVVSMAQNLDLTIVSEGVEDLDQVAFLKSIGCDLVQGYVFFRPMPIKDIEPLLAAL